VFFVILHLSYVDSSPLIFVDNISEGASCLVQTVLQEESPVFNEIFDTAIFFPVV
jgi:hypothetical protein